MMSSQDTSPVSGSGQLTLNFPIEEECNFSSFIREPLNEGVLHALEGLQQTEESPVFIWGEQGSGKTHLLQALCQQHENSMYLPLAEVLDYGVSVFDGLERLRLVCLDDIHLLSGKEEWQTALFGLFNRIREQQNLLILSTACPLAQLDFRLADLTSRLQWGPIFQVHPLSDEGKVRLLTEAGERRGIRFADDVISYILHRSERSISSLYRVLDTLDSLSLVEKRRITQPFVRRIMNW